MARQATPEELTAPALAELRPVTLTGRRVTAEALTSSDAPDLYEFSKDPRLWTWMPRGPFASLEDVERSIGQALAAQATGSLLSFVVRRITDCKLVGHLRYEDPQPLHGSVEIGAVMIAPEHQREKLGHEACLLLFEYAFETLGATRVWMKTDARNEPARRGMESMGMTYEGTLRQHARVRDGYLRDSAVYSFIADEWPEKKRHIQRHIDEGSG